MSVDIAPLLKLDPVERLQLVEDLWDSLVADAEAQPVPDWKVTELNRRQARFMAHPESARTWDQVTERARATDD